MILEEITGKIKAGEVFSFARYGDGEWRAMLNRTNKDGNRAQNCDGHEYYDDLGDRLLSILKSSPQYHLGLQRLGYSQYKEQIDQLTHDHRLAWCGSDVFHKANIHGALGVFWDVLTDRDVLVVGASHLRQVPKEILTATYFCEVPAKNCWEEYEAVKACVGNYIKVYGSDLVILYCASMMSEVLIDDYAGQCTQIDLGSVLDPYVGKISRSYMHKLNIDQ